MRDGEGTAERQGPTQTPLLRAKDHAAPSLFRPEHLLREARRQRGIPEREVLEICVLDPDGDLWRATGRSNAAGGPSSG